MTVALKPDGWLADAIRNAERTVAGMSPVRLRLARQKFDLPRGKSGGPS